MSPSVSSSVQQVPLWINNADVSTSKTFDVKHPRTGKVVTQASAVGSEELNNAIASSRKAFLSWRDQPANARAAVLMKAADLLEKNTEKYWDAYKHDTSVSQLTLMSDVGFALEHIRKAASVATEIKGEIPQTVDGSMALVLREPFGVVLSVSPFNMGLTLALRAIVYPLAVGNTVILKASPIIPFLNYLMGPLFAEAGLPEGCLQVVQFAPGTDGQLMEQAIAHPDVRFVNFTGSTRVGSIIGSLAGKYIKPVVLELGGKAPALVFESADLARAANNIIFGAMLHAGQTCMCTEIVIVVESVADALIEELRKVSETQLAPLGKLELATQVGVEKMQRMVKDALSKGAKPITLAGKESEDQSLGYVPVILTDVQPDMDIYAQETFGPGLVVVRVKNEEEAIKLANGEFGLTSSVWTEDYKQALSVAKRIEASAVHINSVSVHDSASLPHGGHKNSGFGRFNGIHAAYTFTQTKTITLKEPADLPIFMLK